MSTESSSSFDLSLDKLSVMNTTLHFDRLGERHVCWIREPPLPLTPFILTSPWFITFTDVEMHDILLLSEPGPESSHLGLSLSLDIVLSQTPHCAFVLGVSL